MVSGQFAHGRHAQGQFLPFIAAAAFQVCTCRHAPVDTWQTLNVQMRTTSVTYSISTPRHSSPAIRTAPPRYEQASSLHACVPALFFHARYHGVKAVTSQICRCTTQAPLFLDNARPGPALHGKWIPVQCDISTNALLGLLKGRVEKEEKMQVTNFRKLMRTSRLSTRTDGRTGRTSHARQPRLRSREHGIASRLQEPCS